MAVQKSGARAASKPKEKAPPKRTLVIEVQGGRIRVYSPGEAVSPFEAPIILEKARQLAMMQIDNIQPEVQGG